MFFPKKLDFSSESLVEVVQCVGVIFLIFSLLKHFLVVIYQFYIGPWLKLNVDVRSYGPWAVITGSSDGIGKAYAEEFARLGINVVLISRTLQKLKTLSSRLEKEHAIQTKIIDLDFSEDLDNIYKRIEKELEGLEIGILVNNVGIFYRYPEYLAEIPDAEKFFRNLLNVNCLSALMMCRIVIPQMVNRRKGIILNISSAAGEFNMPLISAYSATKAFVNTFSLSLSKEYKEKGIIIQNVTPALVATNMGKVTIPTFFAPYPTVFVRSQIRTIGLCLSTEGYIGHMLKMAFYRTSIDFGLLIIVNKTFFKYWLTKRNIYLNNKRKYALMSNNSP